MAKNYKIAKLEGIDSNGNEKISLVDTLEINIKAQKIEATESIHSANIKADENISGPKITTDNLKSKSGSVIGSDNLSFTAATGSEKSIDFIMAENDAAHIKVGGGSNEGYLELATKDDGTEPIYVKQYGSSSTRTATLLDGSGNTSFPGTVSAGGKNLATTESVTNHTGNKDNPHKVTKAQIGLGDVDNTSDENKPLSRDAREAFNNVAYTAIQCDSFNTDDPGKGVTPAAAKKAVTTFGVLKEGDSTITGDLKINGNLHANGIGVDDLANIELIGNGNLQDVINDINTSIGEASESASNAGAKATQAIKQIDSINQDKLDKTEAAVKANGITDYRDRNNTINIGWTGSGLETTEHFAAYQDGQHIKDISVANTKTVLGINNKMDKDAIIFEFDSNTKTLNIKTK